MDGGRRDHTKITSENVRNIDARCFSSLELELEFGRNRSSLISLITTLPLVSVDLHCTVEARRGEARNETILNMASLIISSPPTSDPSNLRVQNTFLTGLKKYDPICVFPMSASDSPPRFLQIISPLFWREF
jgi:hypothetical protein